MIKTYLNKTEIRKLILPKEHGQFRHIDITTVLIPNTP